MRFAVFASGNGSNFEAIVRAVENKEISATLVCLFSDKINAYVIERAKKKKIPYMVIEKEKQETKESYEKKIIEYLEEKSIDFIVLAGYMKILGHVLLEKYPKKIINLHPSLLPSFPGKQGIHDAFYSKEKETGITIHLVDQGIDTGPIIFQHAISIARHETLSSLETRIHELEHQYYPIVIEKYIREVVLNDKKKSLN